MKVPIIIDEYGDIELYASVSDAALDIEPFDVLNREYTVYDSEGSVLQLSVRKVDGIVPYVEKVVIEEPDLTTNRADELREKLEDFFTQVDEGVFYGKHKLNELVIIGIKFFKLRL